MNINKDNQIMGTCANDKLKGFDKVKQDLFVIDTPQIGNHLNPQYFILVTSYDQYHANYETTIKNTYQQLNFHTNRQQLQSYQQDNKNNVLIICCKNIHQINEARKLANFHTFSKIGVAYNFDIDNIEKVRQGLQREMGFRFKSIFRDDVNQIKKFFESANQKQSIYFCHKDMGLINRTLVLFHYFFRKDYNHSEERFFKWLQSKNKGNTLVQMIEVSKQSKQELGSFLLKSLLSESVLLKQAIELLGTTRNPGVLVNISWFISSIFRHIKLSYDKNLETLKTMKISEFVVWVQLTKQQVANLPKSQGENFMFSTFMMGETKDYTPEQTKDSNNWYKIFINLPKDLASYDKEVDLGFYIHQNKVILNIFNMYHVDSVSLEDRTLNVTYSSIGCQIKLRNGEFRYYKDAQKGNIRMIKLYDYYHLNQFQLQDQFDLVYLLQMYCQYKRMATLYSTASKNNNKQTLSTRVNSTNDSFQNKLNEYLGDCEYQTKQEDRAISYYQNVFPQERGLIKQLYIHHSKSVGTQFRKTMQQLRETQQLRSIKVYGKFTTIAFNNFSAIMSCRSGDYNLASKKVNQALVQMSKALNHCNFHSESYTSFPLYSLVQRTNASIARYKGELVQAQLTENQCRVNELMFDGVHRIWLQRQFV